MKKLSREEKSWVLYDWANSVFATIMMAAVYPIFFSSISAAAGQSGDLWWSIGAVVSTAVVAIAAPILGSFADYKGVKKKLFVFFLALGLVFTLVCAFTDQWQLMLVGYVLGCIGFSGSCFLYDSFLPDITTPDRMDAISSLGYGLGYIGGSTIPFLVSIALITFGSRIGIGSTLAVQLSVGLTVVWWLVFSIPFLKNIKQVHFIETPKTQLVSKTFTKLGATLLEIIRDKGLLFFILAYFFYIDGVNTVIKMATSYGATLGLDNVGMILALLVTQIVAFPCAILFGRLCGKFGTVPMLSIAIGIYCFICVMGFIMGFGLEEGFLTLRGAGYIFWAMAALVGSVQGGIQAISRSYFARLVPPEKSGEYFGFFDIFGRFAAIIGPALYAGVKAVTGRSSYSILSVIFLFIVGGIILQLGKGHMQQTEARVASKTKVSV